MSFKENFMEALDTTMATEEKDETLENTEGFSGKDVAVAGLVTLTVIGTGVLLVKGVKKIFKKDDFTAETSNEKVENTKAPTKSESKKDGMLTRFAKNKLDKAGLMIVSRSEYEELMELKNEKVD